MTKIYLTGTESINNEIKEFLNGKAEFIDTMGSADIIFNTTNYPEYEKSEELQYIESVTPKTVPIFTSSLCQTVSDQCRLQGNPERLICIGLYNTFSKANRIEIAP